MVQKFMVEKSGVEWSGVEAWGWKVWGWDVFLPAIPPTVLKSVFDDVSLSVLSRDFLFGVLKWGKDSALQSNCASKKFGVLKSPLMLEFESSTSAIACSFPLSEK